MLQKRRAPWLVGHKVLEEGRVVECNSVIFDTEYHPSVIHCERFGHIKGRTQLRHHRNQGHRWGDADTFQRIRVNGVDDWRRERHTDFEEIGSSGAKSHPAAEESTREATPGEWSYWS